MAQTDRRRVCPASRKQAPQRGHPRGDAHRSRAASSSGTTPGSSAACSPTSRSPSRSNTPFLKGLVVAILLAGAAVGALVAGRIADQLGRRRTILITSIVFVVGLLAVVARPARSGCSGSSRFVIGLGVGSTSFVVPLYIGEIAPPERRGGLVSLNQLSVTIGILVSELVAYFLAGHGDWRFSVGLALLPAVVLGLGIAREPESPAWLVRQGRDRRRPRGATHAARRARTPSRTRSRMCVT